MVQYTHLKTHLITRYATVSYLQYSCKQWWGAAVCRLHMHEDSTEVNILFLKRPGTEVWMLMQQISLSWRRSFIYFRTQEMSRILSI